MVCVCAWCPYGIFEGSTEASLDVRTQYNKKTNIILYREMWRRGWHSSGDNDVYQQEPKSVLEKCILRALFCR